MVLLSLLSVRDGSNSGGKKSAAIANGLTDCVSVCLCGCAVDAVNDMIML